MFTRVPEMHCQRGQPVSGFASLVLRFDQSNRTSPFGISLTILTNILSGDVVPFRSESTLLVANSGRLKFADRSARQNLSKPTHDPQSAA